MHGLAIFFSHQRDAVDRQLVDVLLGFVDVQTGDRLKAAFWLFFAFRKFLGDHAVVLREVWADRVLALHHHEPLGAGAVHAAVDDTPALHRAGPHLDQGRLCDPVGGRERRKTQILALGAGVRIQ